MFCSSTSAALHQSSNSKPFPGSAWLWWQSPTLYPQSSLPCNGACNYVAIFGTHIVHEMNSQEYSYTLSPTMRTLNHSGTSISLECMISTDRGWSQCVARSWLPVDHRSWALCSWTTPPLPLLVYSWVPCACHTPDFPSPGIPTVDHLAVGRKYHWFPAPATQCWFITRIFAPTVFLSPRQKLQQGPNPGHCCAIFRRAIIRNIYRGKKKMAGGLCLRTVNSELWTAETG